MVLNPHTQLVDTSYFFFLHTKGSLLELHLSYFLGISEPLVTTDPIFGKKGFFRISPCLVMCKSVLKMQNRLPDVVFSHCLQKFSLDMRAVPFQPHHRKIRINLRKIVKFLDRQRIQSKISAYFQE